MELRFAYFLYNRGRLYTVQILGTSGQAPTCTEAGWADYATCSRCGFSSFEALYPLGHDFSNGYTVDEKAICDNNGVVSKYCSRCSLRDYIRLIPKTAHNIDGETCSVCGYRTESVYYQYNEEKQTYAVSGRNKSCTVFEIAEKYDDGTNGEHAVTSIADEAFNGCTEIKNFVFGGSLSSIGSNAFLNCTALKNFYFNGTISDWCKIEGLGSLMLNAADPGNVLREKRPFKIYIGNKNFSGEIVIPEGITRIESYTFYGYNRITEVTLPEGLTEIGKYAFANCKNIIRLYLPDGLTETMEYAFYNTNVGLVYVPKSVTFVGNYALGPNNSQIYCEAAEKPTSGWRNKWNYNKNSLSANSVTWNLTRAQFEEWYPDGYPAEVYRQRENF